jgi:hypothetical protein
MKKDESDQLEKMIDLLANEKKVNLDKLDKELESHYNKIVKEESK